MLGLRIVALAACSRFSAPSDNPGATAASNTQSSATDADDSASAAPKVPFGNKPCQSLTQEEQKSLGFNMPVRAAASRTPDDLAYENTCTFESVGAFAIEYTTRQDYDYPHDNLHKASHAAPAGIPGSFYDMLGNL